MSEKHFDDWMQRKKIAMGTEIGVIKEFEFMKKTAMVYVDERELIAWCEAYPLINPEDEDFNELLNDVVVPVLIKVGRGRWYRDTLTDLAFALSSKGKGTGSTEDTSKILEE